jgi:putative nucleotidyltransferase with HDIG domain
MEARQAHEAVSQIVSPVYLVGGSVRDALMERSSVDFDFTTPLDPDRIEAMIRASGRRAYLVGKRFGTVAFRLGETIIEITTFRRESYERGNRRPDVEFVSELQTDLSRRDFTINAMALAGDELLDPFGGREDLMAGIVRAVGAPNERFAEDPLRMLRAARFASQLSFAVEETTRDAIRGLTNRILLVARERWMTELDKLLVGPSAADALRFLADTGLLRYLLPEVQIQVGYEQNNPHHGLDLFEHTCAVVAATEPDVTLRWAALLHDVGKPAARSEKPDRSIYHGHELIGAELVERLALYLKWSAQRRGDVARLVLEHMGADSPLRAADDAAKQR